ncbi:MAG: immunoglobulin domain-containing protein [Verrucomicrobiae bacterium]|nr:immunoglobulin domain-containing protein [Verrucomicrobiae bacterium]
MLGTNYVDTGVTNGITYYYVVTGVRAGCESTNSHCVSATPACTPPPKPTLSYNTPIYAGMTLYLSATSAPGVMYIWEGPNGFNSTNQNPVVPNATEQASGKYTVVAMRDGCASVPATLDVVVQPPVRLSFEVKGDAIVLDWPHGTLLWATNITGPWHVHSGASAPYTNPMRAPQEFFRVQLQ